MTAADHSTMRPRPPATPAAAGGGCWTCARFLGETVAAGRHVVCRREPARPATMAAPDAGCAHWLREPGADDEVRP